MLFLFQLSCLRCFIKFSFTILSICNIKYGMLIEEENNEIINRKELSKNSLKAEGKNVLSESSVWLLL